MRCTSLEQARAAKRKAAELFSDLPELQGLGIALLDDGGFGIKVNLLRRPESVVIPDEIDGVEVKVEIVGSIRPLGV